MSNQFDKYFSRGISSGKTELMYDIEKYKISNGELEELITELEKKQMFISKPFVKKGKSEWDKDYLHSLASGYLADYFSKDYLQHFSDVSKYVHKIESQQRRMRLCIVVVIIVLIITSILFKYISS